MTAAAFALSLITRSIWEPLQIIGATAGGLIGFVFPGMLALHRPSPSLMAPEAQRAREDATGRAGTKANDLGASILIALGILQCVAGVTAQVFSRTAPDDVRVALLG